MDVPWYTVAAVDISAWPRHPQIRRLERHSRDRGSCELHLMQLDQGIGEKPFLHFRILLCDDLPIVAFIPRASQRAFSLLSHLVPNPSSPNESETHRTPSSLTFSYPSAASLVCFPQHNSPDQAKTRTGAFSPLI